MNVCFVLLLFPGLAMAQDAGCLTTVSQGQVRGTLSLSRGLTVYASYMGIPYGKVAHRFQESEPADNWTGTLDGTKPGSQCFQLDAISGKVVGSEDCLYLNVHTPRINAVSAGNDTNLLPVLVFIHGGSFTSGQSDIYGPNFLMDENVVFVSLNYRLGAFGFINTGTPSAAGNMGFKDQILALKWVRGNINKFGGDPNRVTVSGESAGSMSVSLLVLSPLAKGLFAQAISESGTANCPGLYEVFSPPLKNAKKLAVNLDCPTTDVDDMVKCLQRMDPVRIIEASQAQNPEDAVLPTPETIPSVFAFTAENPNISKNVFLSEWPSVLLEKGEIASEVPYILGVNSHEGLSFHAAKVVSDTELTRRLNEEWGRYAPTAFLFDRRSKDPCEVGSQVRSFYMDDKPVSTDNSSVEGLTNLFGDIYFTMSVRETALAHSKVAPTFLYFFEKQGLFSLLDWAGWPSRVFPLKYPGHADELQYLYHSLYFPPLLGPDLTFSLYFVKLWTSFVRNGKPSDPNGVTWESVDPNGTTPKWFHINDQNQMEDETERISKAAEFWFKLEQNFKNLV